MHLKAQNLCDNGIFFFHCSLTTSMTNWAKTFKGLLFCAYVEIHQVRRMVFDNYQQCPWMLITNKLTCSETNDCSAKEKGSHPQQISLLEVCIFCLCYYLWVLFLVGPFLGGGVFLGKDWIYKCSQNRSWVTECKDGQGRNIPLFSEMQ